MDARPLADARGSVSVLRSGTCAGCLLLLLGYTLPGQDIPILDEEIKPLYFEAIAYPLAARLKHIQGAVVVRAKLDNSGNVISSTAIAGSKILIPDCVANSKKWRFQPTSGKVAIIIYHFKIEGLCTLPCPSLFTFKPPNIATIVIGEPVVDHSARP